MTTFDRHVLARLAAATSLLVALLVVFFIVLDYLEHVDDFMDRGATLEQVVRDYYLLYIPEIVRLTSPLAVFLAAIYVTGRLAQTLQIAALRAAGVSLARIARPYALFGGTVAVAMFGFNGWIVPQTQGRVLDFQNRYLRNAPEQVQTTQIYRQNAPNSILAVAFYDREAERGYQIGLHAFAVHDGARALARRVDATEMEWIDSLGVWRLRGVTIRDFEHGRTAHVAQLDTALAVLPRDLARTERDVDRLTIPEAAAYVAALRRAGEERLGRPLVAYHTKFSYPLANFLLALVAVPLAAVRRRGGQATRLALGLAVAFAYLSLQKLTEPFGYAGTLPPALVAWLPHAVFLVVAGLLMLWARR